jgi:hypothetical protein
MLTATPVNWKSSMAFTGVASLGCCPARAAVSVRQGARLDTKIRIISHKDHYLLN